MNKKAEVLFPLNKRAMFLGTWKKIPPMSPISSIHFEMLNHRIISHAFRNVYASRKSDEILGVVKQTKGMHRRLANEDLPKVTVKRRLGTD